MGLVVSVVSDKPLIPCRSRHPSPVDYEVIQRSVKTGDLASNLTSRLALCYNSASTMLDEAKGSGGPGIRDKDFSGNEGKFRGKRRKKVSYLTVNKIETVDYKDVPVLRRFINDRGKILSSRQTGNTAKQQRMIATAIRRARELALLPFVVQEMSSDRREPMRRSRDSYLSDAPQNEPATQKEAAVAVEEETASEA